MYARLNPLYGWTYPMEDGSPGPFILVDIECYHGMITGYAPNGRKAARPATEFDALSHDGQDWHPTKEMLSLVPKESRGKVRTTDLPLPSLRGHDS